MIKNSIHINEDNLSIAWAKAFLAVMDKPEISPLTIAVNCLDSIINEHDSIREILDESLLSTNHCSCETVAGTIFPASMWNPQRDARLLFERYMRCRNQIRKCRGNRLGVYFDRLIAHGIDYSDDFTNQLAHIIETYKEKSIHRRSALYASILDPKCDAKHQRQRGFPCLQQVGFVPFDKNHLNVVGFYPTEYIYGRGYGNYLGLSRLGQFMAHEMGLTFSRMTCFVGVGKYGSPTKISKNKLRGLQEQLKSIVNNRDVIEGKK